MKVGEEVEIVGIKDTRKTVCTGVEMFRKVLGFSDEAGDNVGYCFRGIKREDVERGQVVALAWIDNTAYEVQGRDLHPGKKRRRSPYAIFQRLPSAVLFQDHGRDGGSSLYPKEWRW